MENMIKRYVGQEFAEIKALLMKDLKKKDEEPPRKEKKSGDSGNTTSPSLGNDRMNEIDSGQIKFRLVDKIKSPSETMVDKLKSPSVETIYRPAVPKRVELPTDNDDSVETVEKYVLREESSDEEDPRLDQISEYINKIRLNVSDNEKQAVKKDVPSTSTGGETRQGRTQAGPQTDTGNKKEEAIINAEKFKASVIVPPKGECSDLTELVQGIMQQIKTSNEENNDDDFFHTVCHIELPLRQKIEKGEYVELTKLKQKMNRYLHEEEHSGKLMSLVNRDGHSYFVPAQDRESKILNVKDWDKAFRVYTTIYTKANPHRAAEILQYVDIIHRAAATFNWENVAAYDYVFRQLMASKPNRSWAKTYTQMWNLTLCGTPATNNPGHVRSVQSSQGHPGKHNEGGGSGSANHNRKRGSSWKDRCCWRFNKQGGKCKFGKNCRFEHRCNYCGSYDHAASNCPKKGGDSRADKRKSE